MQAPKCIPLLLPLPSACLPQGIIHQQQVKMDPLAPGIKIKGKSMHGNQLPH